jgi:hypothetical protein
MSAPQWSHGTMMTLRPHDWQKLMARSRGSAVSQWGHFSGGRASAPAAKPSGPAWASSATASSPKTWTIALGLIAIAALA